MNNLSDLSARIDAETSLQEERQRRLHQERLDAYEQRRNRYRDVYVPAMNRLKAVWFPRLEILEEKLQATARRFGEKVAASTAFAPSVREPHSGTTEFVGDSTLARVRATFTYYHDVDIRKLVIEYNLEVIPVFLRFEGDARLEVPIEAFDAEEAARWLDDRIVNFVRTYLAIHENATYLADQMVEDPIARVRFPKFAAGSVGQSNGSTFYFISPETKREFESTELTTPQCAGV